MSSPDFTLIDLPRPQPVGDPEAYLHSALQWHFGPKTGSRFWLDRATTLDFDPLNDVRSFDDLALFPYVVDELRDVPVRDLVPAGYGPNAPAPEVYESGGTTGAPKRVVFMPDWNQQLAEFSVRELADQSGLHDSGVLMVGPSGPHGFAHIMRLVAASLKSVLFTVDLDPRWVKKLLARSETGETTAYVDHVIEQAGRILLSQDVTMLTTTPPLLVAMARDEKLVDAINAKVLRINAGGAHFDEDTGDILRDMFPNATIRNVYGSTMVLGTARLREPHSAGDLFIHDAQSPYITFSVIDPGIGQKVAYGERGQVVMNHVSKAMFLPNNLERDTAVRVRGPAGQVGDSLSQIKPVDTFGGKPVIEGVY